MVPVEPKAPEPLQQEQEPLPTRAERGVREAHGPGHRVLPLLGSLRASQQPLGPLLQASPCQLRTSKFSSADLNLEIFHNLMKPETFEFLGNLPTEHFTENLSAGWVFNPLIFGLFLDGWQVCDCRSQAQKVRNALGFSGVETERGSARHNL